jgi:hypothetical protein
MQPPAYVPPPLPPELVPLGGTDWNRVVPVKGVDGDTVRILREQLTWKLVDQCELGDTQRLEDWRLRRLHDDPVDLPRGLPGRLVHLDTPELSSKDPAERDQARAAAALAWAWVLAHADVLRCITYDTGGGFDRLLIDLYVLSPDGLTVEDSLSQYMLRQGWAPYLPGK